MPDSGSIDVEVRDTMFAWSRGQQPSVLFDFNGTLSNDEPDLLCETFGAVFRECLGWHMTESVYLEEFVRLSDTEIITTAVQQHGDGTAEQISQLKQRHTAMYNERAEQEVLIGTETVRLVEMLAGQDIPMGIVTGAQREQVMAVLRSSPIAKFISVIVTDEDVRQGKPDPMGYTKGAQMLRVPARDVLVFEDSVVGVNAALAAGMRCIAIAGDRPSDELRKTVPCVIRRLTPCLLVRCFDRR
jgi:beta-phosphoglucomutase